MSCRFQYNVLCFKVTSPYVKLEDCLMREKRCVKWILLAIVALIVIVFLYNQNNLSKCQTYSSKEAMLESLQGLYRCGNPDSDNIYWEMIIDGDKVTTYTITTDGTKKFEETYLANWYPQKGTFTYKYGENNKTAKYRVDKGGGSISSKIDESWVYSKIDYVDYTPARSNDAWVAAKEVVKKNLKAPATAEFCQISDASIWAENGIYTISGYVDAQNSYGALLRKKFVVELKLTSSGYKDASIIFE